MNLTVYVVDDEETIICGLRLERKKQYPVETFRDAESALEKIDTDAPDATRASGLQREISDLQSQFEQKRIDHH